MHRLHPRGDACAEKPFTEYTLTLRSEGVRPHEIIMRARSGAKPDEFRAPVPARRSGNKNVVNVGPELPFLRRHFPRLVPRRREVIHVGPRRRVKFLHRSRRDDARPVRLVPVLPKHTRFGVLLTPRFRHGERLVVRLRADGTNKNEFIEGVPEGFEEPRDGLLLIPGDDAKRNRG